MHAGLKSLCGFLKFMPVTLIIFNTLYTFNPHQKKFILKKLFSLKIYYFFTDTNYGIEYGLVFKFSNTGYIYYGLGFEGFSVFAFWDTDFMTIKILQENTGIDKKILNTQKAQNRLSKTKYTLGVDNNFVLLSIV